MLVSFYFVCKNYEKKKIQLSLTLLITWSCGTSPSTLKGEEVGVMTVATETPQRPLDRLSIDHMEDEIGLRDLEVTLIHDVPGLVHVAYFEAVGLQPGRRPVLGAQAVDIVTHGNWWVRFAAY